MAFWVQVISRMGHESDVSGSIYFHELFDFVESEDSELVTRGMRRAFWEELGSLFGLCGCRWCLEGEFPIEKSIGVVLLDL